MQQAFDWFEQNAMPIIGGVILFVAAMAIYVVAARSHKPKVQTDSKDPGGE